MNAKDVKGLAVAAFYAASGRYVSAAVKSLKHWKAILTIISTTIVVFVVIISLIVSLPGLIMQSILPSDQTEKQTTLTTFASTEINSTEVEKKSFISELLSSLSTKDENAVFEGNEPSKEEVLIIYAVKYGGYFDENELDKGKIRQITRSFLTIKGLTVSVKPFQQVVFESGLTDEQATIAMQMYKNHMYDQTVPISGGDAIKDYGNITYKNGETPVVYYSQRDARWADLYYGDTTIGRTACGPSSLAMVVSSLTDRNITPKEMSDWAFQNGFKCKGSGSYWSLIPNGARYFGLNVEKEVKDRQQIVDALAEGKLIIVIMGPGHFTSSGHFMVLRGVTEDGKILIADPYSKKNTDRAWDLNTIVSEAKRGGAAGGPFWIISK